MQSITSLTFLFLLFCLSANSQEKTFDFKAQVFYEREPLKEATIEIYEAGDLVFETQTKGNGKFDFELEAERQYHVEVSHENARTKVIWINTKGTKNLKVKVPTFGFDVYLEEEEITKFDELSEIPVTLIKYQPKKEEFYMDKTYGEVIKSQRQKIKDNSLDLRRVK